ncbi:MAG: hypothetical protein ACI955_001921 [Zhongshania sp.]|jgi:hypothetical protein
MTRFYLAPLQTAALHQRQTVVLTLLKTVILPVLAHKPTNRHPRLDRESINLELWAIPHSSSR